VSVVLNLVIFHYFFSDYTQILIDRKKEYLGIDFFGLFTKFDPNIYVGGDNVIFWDH